MVLDHFYDEDMDNRPEGCHFMGHLEHELDSCIGITTMFDLTLKNLD